jgi:DNA-binding response OmpR family regulator
MANILIVEDEAPIADLVADHLIRRSHDVTKISDGDRAFEWLGLGAGPPLAACPELLVLDVMLPGRNGINLCEALRRAPLSKQPVILMLTAKRNEEDAVAGFEAGADDYVRKPFGVVELVRRIEALLALSIRASPAPVGNGRGVRIDAQARTVHVGHVNVRFTPKEYDLLTHLVAHSGIILDRERLLVDVWGYAHAGYARTVDSHVTRIRKKLEAAGLEFDPITTVHGIGYRYEDA